MSHLKLSGAARHDLQRLYRFLAQFDPAVADNGNQSLIAALDYLVDHPDSGSPVEGRPQVRKSVVTFGASGYLIFHRHYADQGLTLVARILHQKEWYDAAQIGLAELGPPPIQSPG